MVKTGFPLQELVQVLGSLGKLLDISELQCPLQEKMGTLMVAALEDLVPSSISQRGVILSVEWSGEPKRSLIEFLSCVLPAVCQQTSD